MAFGTGSTFWILTLVSVYFSAASDTAEIFDDRTTEASVATDRATVLGMEGREDSSDNSITLVADPLYISAASDTAEIFDDRTTEASVATDRATVLGMEGREDSSDNSITIAADPPKGIFQRLFSSRAFSAGFAGDVVPQQSRTLKLKRFAADLEEQLAASVATDVAADDADAVEKPQRRAVSLLQMGASYRNSKSKHDEF